MNPTPFSLFLGMWLALGNSWTLNDEKDDEDEPPEEDDDEEAEEDEGEGGSEASYFRGSG